MHTRPLTTTADEYMGDRGLNFSLNLQTFNLVYADSEGYVKSVSLHRLTTVSVASNAIDTKI